MKCAWGSMEVNGAASARSMGMHELHSTARMRRQEEVCPGTHGVTWGNLDMFLHGMDAEHSLLTRSTNANAGPCRGQKE